MKAGGETRVHGPLGPVLLATMLMVAAGFWLSGPWLDRLQKTGHSKAPQSFPAETVLPPSSKPLPGDQLLHAFGTPRSSALEDLRRLAQVLTNFRLVHKHVDVRFLATNQDLSAALRGELATTRPFVSANSRVFGSEALLIDRWGRPLIIHVVSSERIELRSAGPDEKPWTVDDLVWPPTSPDR